jgi:hypothetical protein
VTEVEPGDVFVHRARISVRASDASAGVSTLHAAENRLPRILSDLGRSIGNEFVALKCLDLRISAWVGAGVSSSLERALRAAIAARIDEARRASGVSRDVAWFPSESAAIAAYLSGLATGDDDWPFAVFHQLGTTWTDVLVSCAARGRAFAGDVLVEAWKLCGENTLIRQVPNPGVVTELWTTASAHRLDALPFPADSLKACEPACSDEHVELVGLVRLFARWPPARDIALDPALLRRLVLRTPERASRAVRHESKAGGLLVWAELLARSGLGERLAAAYPIERARSTVLWALGRALESPSLGARDPLLLLFCGENPDSAVFPDFTLRANDPEPLGAIVLRALVHEFGPAPVRLAPFGDGAVAVADPGIVVFWSPSASVNDAVTILARQFLAVTGVAPASIEVRDSILPEDLELIHAVDVPALPDSWRAGTMGVASLLTLFLGRTWRASLRDCRAWTASTTNGEVMLRARDVRRVANGAWLRDGTVRMSNREILVRVD